MWMRMLEVVGAGCWRGVGLGGEAVRGGCGREGAVGENMGLETV